MVVITDRIDLDDQLFGTFARCHELLRQQPMQAESREQLRALLTTDSGGVIFTTVHKFFPAAEEVKFPLLSERRNIVVLADEAHRSQYDFVDGFASHMRDALPGASFIGFTGTPIEKADANTRAVFGDYVSVYDIERAVKDGATVPIFYESRLAKLKLDEAKKPKLDEEFEEATEGEEDGVKQKLKTKWAALEALVGATERIKLVAADLVAHWERRLETMDGKAMIVCMSRRICVDLYNELIGLVQEMREAQQHGERLGLTDDEIAFYDALEVNDSAVKILGDEILKQIAQDLVRSVRSNLAIDWAVRENVRANLRVIVKRILRKHGYPPDKQEKATDTVLEQAEVLSRVWIDP